MNDLPRLAAKALQSALRALPIAVVTGARQTGKTTLVRDLWSDDDRTYLTLDDIDVLEQAQRTPEDLVARARRLTLDEVQRAPDLLLAVKRAVDRQRTRGRFILTGSANLLVMRHIADRLSGRAGFVTLWPLTRQERLGQGRAGWWPELLDADDGDWLDVLRARDRAPEDWRATVRVGGYPTPALELDRAADRATWFTGYIRTYLERDLSDLAAISSLPDFRRLMRVTCLRLGQLLNQTELGRDAALPQPTVHRWLNLLETSYQLVRLPAFSVNRTKRLIKTPKAYWADTGLALHLGDSESPSGAHFENLVLMDLLAWRDAAAPRADIFYWRTASGEEVDFVIDTGSHLVPIEVKADRHPHVDDARHLQTFRAEYGKKARTGLLLHGGDTLSWLAPGILAAPWWSVL